MCCPLRFFSRCRSFKNDKSGQREEALAAVDTKLGNAPVNEDRLFGE
ncbi:MAG: hypothetical protein IIV03_05305 [Clostridia bacterium]|nr:hypothetical protein [Clostridia bacterium]MBQ5649538.1 hypothetical protein [Clostridia bacterium]MBQ5808321.1 hypothetical protein [Clostridia bacterium]MBR0327663.1 hypothetical protein [Clostridia bacterium]